MFPNNDINNNSLTFEYVVDDNECCQVFLQYLQAHQNSEQLECIIEIKKLKVEMDSIISNINSEDVSNNNYQIRNELARILSDFPVSDKKKKRRSLFSDQSSSSSSSEHTVKTIFRNLLDFCVTFLHVNSKRELNLPQNLRNKLSQQIQTFWSMYSKKFGFDEQLLCLTRNDSNRNSTIPITYDHSNDVFHADNIINIEVTTTDFYDFLTDVNIQDKSLLNSPKQLTQITELTGGMSPVSSLSDNSFDENSILEDFLFSISKVEEVLKELETFIRLQVKTESFRDFCKSEHLNNFIQKMNPSNDFLKELKRSYRQSTIRYSTNSMKEDSNNLSVMLLNDKLLKWTMKDVLEWVREHCLEEMINFITEHKIDGSKLSHLEQYVNDQIYPSLEVRKKFEYEVDELLTSFGFEPLPNTDFPEISARRKSQVPKNSLDVANDTFIVNCQLASQQSEVKKIKLKSKQLINYYSLVKILKDTFGIESDSTNLEIMVVQSTDTNTQNESSSLESVNNNNSKTISPSNILKTFKKDIMNQVGKGQSSSCMLPKDQTSTELFEKKLIINIC